MKNFILEASSGICSVVMNITVGDLNILNTTANFSDFTEYDDSYELHDEDLEIVIKKDWEFEQFENMYTFKNGTTVIDFEIL